MENKKGNYYLGFRVGLGGVQISSAGTAHSAGVPQKSVSDKEEAQALLEVVRQCY